MDDLILFALQRTASVLKSKDMQRYVSPGKRNEFEQLLATTREIGQLADSDRRGCEDKHEQAQHCVVDPLAHNRTVGTAASGLVFKTQLNDTRVAVSARRGEGGGTRRRRGRAAHSSAPVNMASGATTPRSPSR